MVFAPAVPGQARRVLSLGEAKWGETMTGRHLDRLRRARNLLALKGYDADQAVLACYGAGGFEEDLRSSARRREAALVDLADLY